MDLPHTLDEVGPWFARLSSTSVALAWLGLELVVAVVVLALLVWLAWRFLARRP